MTADAVCCLTQRLVVCRLSVVVPFVLVVNASPPTLCYVVGISGGAQLQPPKRFFLIAFIDDTFAAYASRRDGKRCSWSQCWLRCHSVQAVVSRYFLVLRVVVTLALKAR
ncbi:hypothetical protein SPRG_19410 [Saprolegnia parasitica CBS 223.65]|uniref:Uncharacterized protein n=1 Tax=Saprolegnia parasitica (strain CBS 223.65) TaxID=695850 RepID=A0A067D0R0_SAPPC|nr:hypothetical protein SPRG_19410 [Saprolegnia parasitica CBS 223.65]KDO32617.1 hypothetical protein SPRG_19410 [Saprolegnia parasitica CBS 223.65]|eukprot:XP_012196650.1 hypothetical protein SPRG_19410 [Saprolegnia parasitica CBS 223.65]